MSERIGTAGIPGVCKGGSTLDGVKCVSDLGLDAFEIAFVRNIYLTEESARKVGEIAKKLDISLSCHAPYYINLASTNPSVIVKSKKFIADTLKIADVMGAKIAVVHAGFYMGQPKSQVFELIKNACLEFKSKAKLGIETMGRQKQFGSVDEVARLVEECGNVAPVIDFAHIHARTNGGLKTKDDFKAILDKFECLSVSPIHCHMTGIKYENGNEKHHLPISSFEPDFRLLADVLRENNYDTTIICESPLMEQDALLFKKWITNRTKL
ncbi:MAG: TIM barrel protein [Candidatus Aenigmarchaeota archaeon]|nr:TIM barrel protein [Candidatus Aenigmarchaeota archaeon]